MHAHHAGSKYLQHKLRMPYSYTIGQPIFLGTHETSLIHHSDTVATVQYTTGSKVNVNGAEYICSYKLNIIRYLTNYIHIANIKTETMYKGYWHTVHVASYLTCT